MSGGRYRAICEFLDVEFNLKEVTDEIMLMLAGLNDKLEADNIGWVVGLLPSRKGTRIVFLRFDSIEDMVKEPLHTSPSKSSQAYWNEVWKGDQLGTLI